MSADVGVVGLVLSLFGKLDDGSDVGSKDMNSVKGKKAWVFNFVYACNTKRSFTATIKVGKVIRIHKDLEIEGLIRRIVIKA
jgi:hypothetical protein